MTVDTYYPQRSIDDLLHKMAVATYITTLDMPSAFYQIPLAKLSQLYSAFTTHLGAFALTRAGMGMKGSSFTLSMALDMALGHLRPNVDNYADDIFITSNSIDSHLSQIEATLEAFINANMVVSPQKSNFFRTQVNVLGHTVGRGFVKPDHDKTEAIMKMSPPKNRTGVRSFLGMTSFFRRFISRYAHIAKPLTVLTSDNVPFVWSQEQQEAFDALKKKLCEGPILRAPDHKKTWYIISDASSKAVGAWLAQRHQGVLHPVSYHSRVLKECELKWALDTYECETLSIYDALKKFAPYIYGSRVIILSDNRSLQWLFTKGQYKSPRLTRWALNIQQVGAEVLHLPGVANRPADTLSRYPLLQEDIESPQQSVVRDSSSQAPETTSVVANTTDTAMLPKRISPARLMDVEDPAERDFIARAELIVDGNPTDPNSLFLVKYWEQNGTLERASNTVTIHSIRQNTPDAVDDYENAIWTQDEIKEKQRADALLKHIINYIEDPSHINKQYVDPNIRDLDSFLLDLNGILFKKVNDEETALIRGSEEVICVPYTLQKRAMQTAHNSDIAAHTGPERTLWMARRHFWWRHMAKHIKSYVKACKSCHVHKGNPHPQIPSRRYPIPDRPWERVSIDLIGRLPTSRSGSKFILVAVDALTRYAVAEPLKTRSAKEVATALTKIFCEHGIPQTLLSDNGTEFNNHIMKALAQSFQFKYAKIAVHHPSSQGLVERKNQAIMLAIRQLAEDKPEEWDACIPIAMLAINSAYNVNLKDTPFFLYRHRDSNLSMCANTRPQSSTKTPQQFVNEEIHRNRTTYDIIRERLLEATDEQCRRKDRTSKPARINIDDRVYVKLVKNKKGQGKLTPKWLGPFRVLSQLSPSGYKIRHIISGKIKTVHPENMKIVAEESAAADIIPQARNPLHPLEDSEIDLEQVVRTGNPEPSPVQGETSQHPSSRQKAPAAQKKKRNEQQHRPLPQQHGSDHRPLPSNDPETQPEPRRNPTRVTRSNISYSEWDDEPHPQQIG